MDHPRVPLGDEPESDRRRARRLAQEKAYLELVNDLLVSLFALSGLESTMEGIARLIIEKIGSTEACIYCWTDGGLIRGDAFGARTVLIQPDDEMVRAVIASGRPLEVQREFADSQMVLPAATPTSSWAIPLRADGRLVGVLRMDGMLVSAEAMTTHLGPFFRCAALQLKREIETHERIERLERLNAGLRTTTHG